MKKNIFKYAVYFVVTDEFIAFHQSSMLLELRKARLASMFVISLCEKWNTIRKQFTDRSLI